MQQREIKEIDLRRYYTFGVSMLKFMLLVGTLGLVIVGLHELFS